MAIYPIVGAFYRPPAKQLLAALAVGTPLIVRAEPDNQYDVNACAVWLRSADIPDSALAELDGTLPDCGKSLDEVLAEYEWHVGYIPKEMAAALRAQNIVADDDVPGTFAVSASGQPRIVLAD